MKHRLIIAFVLFFSGSSYLSSAQADEQVAEQTKAKLDIRLTSSAERKEERERMVEEQLLTSKDGRKPITSPRVLDAMRAVPRHLFVPRFVGPLPVRSMAYEDTALPIGEGQTISQPYIVALMTELADIQTGERVLEVGTGSGYQAAVLAQLTPEVYSVEVRPELAEQAEKTLAEVGYKVNLKQGDGFEGWEEHAPYDAIIVTFAAPELPPPLWEQLAPGGIIVAPLGESMSSQELTVITKNKDGSRSEETLSTVRFVPMFREGQANTERQRLME